MKPISIPAALFLMVVTGHVRAEPIHHAESGRSAALQALYRLDVWANTELLWWAPLYLPRQTISQHAAAADRKRYPVAHIVCRFLDIFEHDHCNRSLEP